ncbi:MAG: pilus assembly protein PilM, partial [Deltaproteobacteria bacterium]|nr:pilus assembly protein PilM [Deltaproteobacteria bacterium]
VAAFAVENAYEANYETNPSEAVALVNIGAQVVNINIVSDGATAFTRDITTAGNQYTEEIQKALTVSFDEAERLKLGGKNSEESQEVVPQEVEQAMQNVSETVIGEISRSLDFFAATTADSRIEKVFLSGGSSRVTGFENAFHERTGLSVELLNPLNQNFNAAYQPTSGTRSTPKGRLSSTCDAGSPDAVGRRRDGCIPALGHFR